jgi:hypothetical protein
MIPADGKWNLTQFLKVEYLKGMTVGCGTGDPESWKTRL